MLSRSLITLAILGGLVASLSRMEAAQSQSQIPQAIGSCAENLAACRALATGAGFIVWKYGREWFCPTYVAQCAPAKNREFSSQGSGQNFDPNVEEFTFSTSYSGCNEKEKRIRQAHPEWDFMLVARRPNPVRNSFNQVMCIWIGHDRKLVKRYYNN